MAERPSLSPRAWRILVAVIALVAFLVRLEVIRHSHGGSDLRNYVYFARLGLSGHNPFLPPSGAPFGPELANSPPVEYGFFALVLDIRNSPSSLRYVFAAADVLTILVIAFGSPRSQRTRLMLALFVALDPFVLVSWTEFSEDKTIIFLLVAVLFVAVERGWLRCTWATDAALTVFKFLGAFVAPVLVIDSLRRYGRASLLPIAGALVAFALSNLLWFPHSIDAFSRRNQRARIDPPIHASPVMVLSKLGIYRPWEVEVLIVVGIFVAVLCVALRRMSTLEGCAWSFFAGYIFLPDDSFDRLLLVSLPFLLIVSLSLWQWLCLWLWSCVTAVGANIAVHGVPHALASSGSILRTVFGRDSTLPHVLWMNSFVLLVLVLFVSAKRSVPVGAGDGGTRSGPPGRQLSRVSRTAGVLPGAWPADAHRGLRNDWPE